MRYNKNNAVNPMAASSFVPPRCLRILMNTLYEDSRVSNPVMPIKFGTCPTAILMADPVMKAEMAGKEMNSTMKPNRARPRKEMMTPQMIASAEATTWAGYSGFVLATSVTTSPTRSDITATGYTDQYDAYAPSTLGGLEGILTPMVISLDVAKNQ